MGWPLTTPAEHLAAAERYERWASRCIGDDRLAESFRHLAAERGRMREANSCFVLSGRRMDEASGPLTIF